MEERENKKDRRRTVGKGIDKNHNKAFEWYLKSANKGNHIAENELGKLYYFIDKIKTPVKYVSYNPGLFSEFQILSMFLNKTEKDVKEMAFTTSIAN